MRLLHVRPAGYLPERVSLPDITLSIDLTVFYTSLSLMEDSAMDSLLSAYKQLVIAATARFQASTGRTSPPEMF